MTFRVGITGDVRRPDGTLAYAREGLRLLEAAGLETRFLADAPEVSAAEARACDALLVAGPQVTRATLAGADERLALVARVGVGYDNVDVDACREHGVLVTITPDAVRRPMAAAALALLLALAHELPVKDRLVREGRWDEQLEHVGHGLDGRTLGLVGLGNIGREIARLAAPFGMRVLAWTPHLTDARAAAAGVERAERLDDLLACADYVCLVCPLTRATHHLIDRRRLALMRPSAFLVNVARGAVVDQAALVDALRTGALRGAGLDVMDPEPLPPGDPLAALGNAILAPHALGHTRALLAGAYADACASVVALAEGRVPRDLVDPVVGDSPLLRAKLARVAG
jgi:phosphoglycerate dehydrogenase-like enzyme